MSSTTSTPAFVGGGLAALKRASNRRRSEAILQAVDEILDTTPVAMIESAATDTRVTQAPEQAPQQEPAEAHSQLSGVSFDELIAGPGKWLDNRVSSVEQEAREVMPADYELESDEDPGDLVVPMGQNRPVTIASLSLATQRSHSTSLKPRREPPSLTRVIATVLAALVFSGLLAVALFIGLTWSSSGFSGAPEWMPEWLRLVIYSD